MLTPSRYNHLDLCLPTLFLPHLRSSVHHALCGGDWRENPQFRDTQSVQYKVQIARSNVLRRLLKDLRAQ